MRKYLFVLAITAFVLAGCRSTKETSKTNQKEVWQTLLVKHILIMDAAESLSVFLKARRFLV